MVRPMTDRRDGTAVNQSATPWMIVLAGTTGSGKTTVALALCRQLVGAEHLQSDMVRKQLAGLSPLARVATSQLAGGIYSPEMTDSTYEAMNRRAAEALQLRKAVILDGSFRQKIRRQRAVAIAQSNGARVMIIECSIARAVQIERLAIRYSTGASVSEGRPELLSWHERDWERVDDSEADIVIRLDTGVPLDALEHLVAKSMETANVDVDWR